MPASQLARRSAPSSDPAAAEPFPSIDPPMVGPLAAYRLRVERGVLDQDPEQLRAATRLDRLWTELKRQATATPAGSFVGRLLGRRPRPTPPRGVYLVGQVGRGKSMLMDLFYEQVPIAAKRRIHFHRFMQDAHKQVHALKRATPGLADPIPPLADSIAAEAMLLCFDEFQVNDIADAMILGRLFDALFTRGVVVVATSNTLPQDLFQNRPGADAFKPFIARIRQEVDTILQVRSAASKC